MAGPVLALRWLFAHRLAEECGQCGIEGGAGLLLDLLQDLVDGEWDSLRFFGREVVEGLGDADDASEQGCALFS